VNLYSLLVYIEHNGDESPKDNFLKHEDHTRHYKTWNIKGPISYTIDFCVLCFGISTLNISQQSDSVGCNLLPPTPNSSAYVSTYF